MPLSTQEWHRRFREQARWTAGLRAGLFQRAGIRNARRVLEVGCGTGAVLSELQVPSAVTRFGLDIDLPSLSFAQSGLPAAVLLAGDALALPFAPQSCDIVFCHFLLLWLRRPLAALREMRRVVRPRGAVIALAEPDYDARIDSPALLAELGSLQRDSLIRQGADPGAGRRLAGWMAECGLRVVEAGILGARWSPQQKAEVVSEEWNVLRSDVEGLLPENRLEQLRMQDSSARENGARVLFVPTFYCLAKREEG